MKVKSLYLLTLLEDLTEKANVSLDTYGFEVVSGLVGEEIVSKRYLQENIYGRLTHNVDEVDLQMGKLDSLAQFLDFKNFGEFVQYVDNPISPRLKNCLGLWYSYVRVNSGIPELLRAPVRISINNARVLIDLRGRERVFKGSCIERDGNIHVQLDSKEDKILSIILKVGLSKSPQVMQGVFVGISSNGDPICGREVFVKQAVKNFDELTWNQISMDGNSNTEETDQRIINYFIDFNKSCIKINDASNFDLDDLVDKRKH